MFASEQGPALTEFVITRLIWLTWGSESGIVAVAFLFTLSCAHDFSLVSREKTYKAFLSRLVLYKNRAFRFEVLNLCHGRPTILRQVHFCVSCTRRGHLLSLSTPAWRMHTHGFPPISISSEVQFQMDADKFVYVRRNSGCRIFCYLILSFYVGILRASGSIKVGMNACWFSFRLNKTAPTKWYFWLRQWQVCWAAPSWSPDRPGRSLGLLAYPLLPHKRLFPWSSAWKVIWNVDQGSLPPVPKWVYFLLSLTQHSSPR